MRLLPTSILALFVLPLTVQAQFVGSGEEGMAQVVTQNDLPSKCISSIAVHTIDGERAFVPPQGFKIPAGVHSMSGKARLNLSFCKPLRGPDRTTVEPLEAAFEAGKKYYVGIDHSSSNRRDWHYVIWKIEDMSAEDMAPEDDASEG